MPRRHVLPPALDFDPTIPAPLRLAVTRFDGAHPGIHQPAHTHRFFELVYVDSGTGVHRTGELEFSVDAGDVIVIAPGEVHDPRGLATVEGYVLLFGAAAVDSRLTDAELAFGMAPSRDLAPFSFLRAGAHGHEPLHVPAPERPAWRERLETIARELSARALGYDELARAELRIFLLQCARLVAQSRPGLATESRLVCEVLRYIDANYRRPITLADVAKGVGLSRAYLTDRVHQETGRTVGGWITERRMAEARRLLAESDWEVGRIARTLTFVDDHYFSRLFKRLHDMTPSAWRTARR
jgi:AraC-like DNA-binding protein/quercetin dioxygenase-like cupin family protein